MKIIDWLVENMRILHEAGADSPRRDCLVLLEDMLGKDRSWVLTHPEHQLSTTQLDKLNGLIRRRQEREPLAYVRGRAWFYGRFFKVNPDVLIPRPETETFIDLLKKISSQKKIEGYNLTIIDVGTGSGCLAVTAKLEIPQANVIALDNDQKALAIARQNADAHNAEIVFKTSDILTSVYLPNKNQKRSNNYYILLVNLPYVPVGLAVEPEIEFEPKQAIFSGEDGLDHYRVFWSQIQQMKFKPQHIVIESLGSQHKDMIKLAKDSGYDLKLSDTLIQWFKEV